MKYYILYNPLAGKKTGREILENIPFFSNIDEKVFCNLTEIEDFGKFLSDIEKDAAIIVCGGDGTLNKFINNISEFDIKSDIFYCASGSGNDFLKDIGMTDKENPVKINEYIKNLPEVNIGGQGYRFINGVGFGLDGCCCQEMNRLKSLGKKANYTLAAIKSLLFVYKPTSAVVNVDGKEYRYKKVWLTPTMLGKYFGGGMMIAPTQDRNNKAETVTTIVAHSLSIFRLLTLFPTIFKGTHVEYKKYIDVHEGHCISVKFDTPTAMQIDGETVTGVIEYTVSRKNLVKN